MSDKITGFYEYNGKRFASYADAAETTKCNPLTISCTISTAWGVSSNIFNDSEVADVEKIVGTLTQKQRKELDEMFNSIWRDMRDDY